MTDQEKELKRIIELEDPILFLGAGFSLGAKTQHNFDFPTGNQLKEKLINDLLKLPKSSPDFDDLNKYSLANVCDYCEVERSPAHLTDFLIDLFKNSSPATFHHLITKYPWKRIYTTNIDDVVETCFAKENKFLLVQNYVRKSTLQPKGKIEYIKLHGCVNNPSEGLTFSIKSYLDSMLLAKDYRFNNLSLDMHSETIVFLGSDFSEFNIDYYLKLYENSGYHSSKGKLIFINPYPSIIFKSKVRKLGATLIEWDTKTFLEFVAQIYSNKDTSANVTQLRQLTRFGFESYKSIRDKILPVQTYESNLYFGFEPNWTDILTEWDFINSDINHELKKFLTTNSNDKSGIFAIYGKGLSGKSTYLLRMGALLELEGYEVWTFHGKTFNYYEFFKWIKLNDDKSQFALIFDNASYNYRDLSRLLKLIPLSQQLIIITTSRLPMHIRARYNIIESRHVEYYIEPNISTDFAKNIAMKLDEKGYLGTLKKYDGIADRVKFILEKNDTLNILYEITYGRGFRERITRNLLPLLDKDSDARDLLILMSIFEKLDLPFVPKELVSLLFGNRAKETLNAVEDFIKYNSQGDISLRTVFYLQNIMKIASKKKLLTMVRNILTAVAPQLNDNQYSFWTQIEAVCIKEKILRKKLGLKTEEIMIMLYDLKQDLSGSYNYWIQLGIAEQMNKEFDKAMNHFRQAEVLNSSSYMVKNAIGRNFLKQANSLDDQRFAKILFSEGESILLDLISNREEVQVRSFSTHTYLYEKINFLKKFKILPPNDELRQMFTLLNKLIEKDPEDVMAKQIGNYLYDYLKTIKRTNIVKFKYFDLSLIKSILTQYDLDFSDLDDF